MELTVGAILDGKVKSITNFGAFISLPENKTGLVHISEMTNRRISSPNEVVTLHQHVMVKVIDVDKARGRIQLSMKNLKQ